VANRSTEPGLDPSDRQFWLEAARSSDAVLRGQAADNLAGESDAKALKALEMLLGDGDRVVRFKAALAFAQVGDDRGLEAILWALERPELCALALDVLIELRSERARGAIMKFFRRLRLHPLERLLAAAALHGIGEAQGTEFVLGSLSSRRPEVRGMAIELLGRLALPGALERLLEVLSQPNHPHSLDAVRGLAWLRDKRSLPLLRRLSRESSDAELAELCSWALSVIEEALA